MTWDAGFWRSIVQGGLRGENVSSRMPVGVLSLELELAGVKESFYVEKKELFGYMQQIRVHTT